MGRLSVIIGVIVGILTILGAVTGFFRWAWERLGSLFRAHENVHKIPKKTIILVPTANPKGCWWHMGASGDRPAMQVHGTFIVTNITKFNVLLTVAKMKKPTRLGHVSIKDPTSQYHGSYIIPSGSTTKMDFSFWIMPPLKKEGEVFVADVAILDQFGNHHWIKKVEFQYS